jgi:chloride channel 3/4/5
MIHSGAGVRGYLYATWDALSGWIVVALVGIFTGFVAFIIDITEATVSDYKFGYCSTNIFYSRESCCRVDGKELIGDACTTFNRWGSSYATKFGPYLAVALVVGALSSSITMLSRATLPSVARELAENNEDDPSKAFESLPAPKTLYMSAGAGVPEIKTILSGFVIPEFLGFKILVLKAVGAIFAVASGLPLGKEAPLIHIGACIANLVAQMFPKYAHNGKQLREVIVAGAAAGISSAFGAPIGGVLFAYEVSSSVPIEGYTLNYLGIERLLS